MVLYVPRDNLPYLNNVKNVCCANRKHLLDWASLEVLCSLQILIGKSGVRGIENGLEIPRTVPRYLSCHLKVPSHAGCSCQRELESSQ